MFEVVLTNINMPIYEGNCRMSAIAKATLSGFEAVINKNGKLWASYSPISGWKGHI